MFFIAILNIHVVITPHVTELTYMLWNSSWQIFAALEMTNYLGTE